eukprot:9488337-Pyramimonas_sp.AAC.1
MAYRRDRPLPFDNRDVPEGWRVQYEREGLGSCPGAPGRQHIRPARGSVLSDGVLGAPNAYSWLQHRDAEKQMRHHISRQSDQAHFGDVEGVFRSADGPHLERWEHRSP